MELYPHQIKAISKLQNGSILCGDVGTGKSLTSLAYFYEKVCGGKVGFNDGSWGAPTTPRDLYIITTAKKRDSGDWLIECIPFGLSVCSENSRCGIKVTVDSWNNIKKYTNVYGAFFIFDEQRVCGFGAWTKAFLNIARKNKWILLSATPGDTWSDYIPVFIANGFYRNKKDFNSQHCIFNPFTNYPKVDRYVNTKKLIRQRNEILVRMKFIKEAKQKHYYILCSYDKDLYRIVFRDRWNPYENEPIDETGKLCYLMRKVVNSDMSRIDAVFEIMSEHSKAIIFYNFTYELDMLREALSAARIPFSEWNGEKHEEILDGEKWAYLVQYTAGAEGWNCITTDTIIFYSQNYSYRIMVQSSGRIDRMNTPFDELHYYHLRSKAPIDSAILAALRNKRNFNEKAFAGA